MIEVWLFGVLVATLASARSLVLVLVALASGTYLAVTLASAVRATDRARRLARASVLVLAGIAMLVGAIGLRLGAPGSGGELIATCSVLFTSVALFGSCAELAMLGGGVASARLASSRAARRDALAGARTAREKRLASAERAFLTGDDLRAEVSDAESALGRLESALEKLESTRASIEARLAEPASAELGRELEKTRDEIATKLDVGARIFRAASAAAFRLACTAPIRRLLRARPRDLTRGLEGASAESAASLASLEAASSAIEVFLGQAYEARRELAELEARREDPEVEDPWSRATRDLRAIEDAYAAVKERLAVVAMRVGARADMEVVASAAGEVSDKARASGIAASDLRALLDEMTRAESAIQSATPAELDARALSEALSRSTAALDEHETASIDDLLRALREVA